MAEIYLVFLNPKLEGLSIANLDLSEKIGKVVKTNFRAFSAK